jgi:heme exporter protein D
MTRDEAKKKLVGCLTWLAMALSVVATLLAVRQAYREVEDLRARAEACEAERAGPAAERSR